MSQVLEFLDAALTKDSLQGLTQKRKLEYAPCQALHPALVELAAGGGGVLWGVKASCVLLEGLWGLPKAAVPAPSSNPSPVSSLHSYPSSQSTSLGRQLPEPGAFHRGSASRTGFMFQVSGTWHRAAKGPRPACKHPSLARGHYPPTCPAVQAQDPCPLA